MISFGRTLYPAALFMVSLLLIRPSPASGQNVEAEAVSIYLDLSTGAFVSGRERLYRFSSGDDIAPDVATASLTSATLVGVDATVRFPKLPLDAGVSFKRTLGAEGRFAFVKDQTINLEGPSSHRFFADPDVDLMLVSSYMNVRTFPSIWRIQPYATVGIGITNYDFDTMAVPDSLPGPTDDRSVTYRLGGGLAVPVREFVFRVQVNNYLSGYDLKDVVVNVPLQHNLTATVSVGYRIH